MHVDKSNIKLKKNYCMFCMKMQSQLVRHLETVHRDETEVKKFMLLPKKNAERRKIIDMIRKNGNFKYNINAEVNKGQLIVCRRPNIKWDKDAKDFTVCIKCKGFFAKNSIRNHSRTCLKRDFKKQKGIMVMGRKIACRIHKLANNTLKNAVFPVLREDEVVRTIRYDELLILYGNKLCNKYKAEHQHDMIRARLRLLGRFLLALKEINSNVTDFKSLYQPKIYDDCISAINIVAGYNDDEKMFKAPAVAANLSTLIKYVGNLLIMEYIKQEDMENKKLVKDFLKLLIVDIGTSINTTVAETQSARKRHKKVQLPSMEDVQTLYRHLKEKRVKAYNALKESFSSEKWRSLAEVTLIGLQLFNRRRAGEIERTLIEDFQNNEKLNEDMYSDIYKSLSRQNKKIAGKYIRFCIRGKKGRTVPVLLTNEIFECINLLLQYRREMGVPTKNPYIFGLPSNERNRYKYLKACILMRRFSKECNAVHDHTLRGTILRKHVATHCIQLNLNEIDVSDLANFMGHADKIHKEHYRQPLPFRNILKISQYLEAVQGNKENTSSSSSEGEEDDDEPNPRNVNDSNEMEEEDLCLSKYAKSAIILKKRQLSQFILQAKEIKIFLQLFFFAYPAFLIIM